MSLFVSDDEEYMQEVSDRVDAADTPAIKQEHPDQQQQRLEQRPDSDTENPESDDEILFEVPIHYKTPTSLKTIIIQNPTKHHDNNQRFTNLQIKAKSKTIEMSNNISNLKFFSDDKANNNWNGLTSLTQKGNLIPTSTKNYMLGKFVESPTTSQLYLSKIEYVSQIRPNFKYLDESKLLKQQSLRDLQANLDRPTNNNEPATATNGAKVNVVQMSAKSSHENQPRLGGALVARKIEDDEDAVEYMTDDIVPVTGAAITTTDEDAMDVDTTTNTTNNTHEEKRKHVESLLFGDNLDGDLESEMTKDEYLDSLVRDTKTDILQ